MTTLYGFGEQVAGYDIPVLNEREIRAAAGLLFLATFTSFLVILMKGYFVPFKLVVSFFLLDFVVRVFVSPRYAPTLVLGRLIVRNQVPEYVGAAQKKVAWIIGVAMAATMFVLMVVLNTVSVINGLTCLACLVFLFFESAFGICLGCLAYGWIYKDRARYCPGEVCEVSARQPIQRTSGAQALVLLAFVAAIAVAAVTLAGHLSVRPHPLFGAEGRAAEELRAGQGG